MEFEKVLSHFTRAQMYLIKWPFVLNILASNFIQYTGVPKKIGNCVPNQMASFIPNVMVRGVRSKVSSHF